MQAKRIDASGRDFQIKGRCLLPGCKPSQRLGSIDIDKQFDAMRVVADAPRPEVRVRCDQNCAQTAPEHGQPGANGNQVPKRKEA
jgi:hypothetical protein